MLAAASAVLRKGLSVTAFLDQAMASAVSAAMVAAYAALGGIRLVDFVTAGDGKVCGRCLEKAAEGPYSPRDYPGSQHPGCRCTAHPAAGFPLLPVAAFAAYLTKRAA
jgi:hypothetical protein